MRYNEKGEEINDEPAVEIPLRLRRGPTRAEEIMAAVRGALSEVAAAKGSESFEEANDFDVPDEDEMVLSGRQAHLMQVDALEARDRDAEYLEQLELTRAQRRGRIEARLLKEGRSDEHQFEHRGVPAGGAGAANAGERAKEASGAGDGKDGAGRDGRGSGGVGRSARESGGAA